MGYNYKKAIIEDIKTYLDDNYMGPPPDMTYDEYYAQLEDELWDDDTVTGNYSGYDTEENCELYVASNLRLALEALREFGVELKNIPEDNPAQYIDTTIRCYLFTGVLQEVIDNLGEQKE